MYAGEVLDQDAAEGRAQSSGAYIFDVRQGRDWLCVDGCAHRGVASFINFGCEPNLKPGAVTLQSGRTLIGFYARTDIYPVRARGARAGGAGGAARRAAKPEPARATARRALGVRGGCAGRARSSRTCATRTSAWARRRAGCCACAAAPPAEARTS